MPRHERQGIRQGEDDQVVPLVGPLDECPPIVDVDGHPGVPVRPAGVELLAEPVDLRVDLDRIDVACALREGDGDIGAGARSHDEDVVQLQPRRALVRKEIDRLGLPARLHGGDHLVGDAVDAHADGPAAASPGHLVVGRPLGVHHRGLHAEQEQQHGDGDDLERTNGGAEHRDESQRGNKAPGERGGLEQGERREGGDAGDTARDVQAVGVERLEPHEHLRHAGCDRGHHHGGGEEDERQRDPDRHAGRHEVAEVDDLAARAVDLHRIEVDIRHGAGQERSCEREEARAPDGRTEEAKPDAEEAAEQDEVGEVGEVEDVGAGPPDQGQFDEEHQEAQGEQPQLVCRRGSGGSARRGPRCGNRYDERPPDP